MDRCGADLGIFVFLGYSIFFVKLMGFLKKLLQLVWTFICKQILILAQKCKLITKGGQTGKPQKLTKRITPQKHGKTCKRFTGSNFFSIPIKNYLSS